MIKFNGIEHIDEFEGDCNIIYIEVTNEKYQKFIS